MNARPTRRTRSIRLALALAVALPASAASVRAQSLPTDHRAVEVWSIGSIDGPPETLWSRIGDALILDSTLFVIDGGLGQAEVRRDSMDGDFLGLVGGGGQGPGEFQLAAAPTLEGDSVRILDLLSRRKVYYSKGGDHLGTSQVSVPVRNLQRFWTIRGGWTFGWTGLIEDYPPEASVRDHLVVAWPQDGETVDTVQRVAGLPNLVFDPTGLGYVEGGYVRATGGCPYAGPAGGAWMFGDSAFAVVDGMRPSVTLYSVVDGRVEATRVLPLEGAPSPITEEERSFFSDHYWSSREQQAGYRFIPPDSLPAWTLVEGDPGSIWLREGGTAPFDPALGETWAEWAPAGGMKRTATLPPGVRAIAFRFPHVLGVRTDPMLEVESLVLMRMEPRR